MPRRVLHVLAQRPGRTGSGVTLDAVVREAAAAGWEQAALVGVPADETAPDVGGLPPEAVHRVTFAPTDPAWSGPAPDLPFPVPGMSDVMPYPSSVWAELDRAQVARYVQVWRERLATTAAAFAPDVIQVNHLWLVASILKDAVPDVPAVATCHATGLRQMNRCPGLAPAVVAGCARLDRFAVLHEGHRTELAARLAVDPQRITVVGAGYRDEVFRGPAAPAAERRGRLLYVGKTSRAKGVPWLLDAHLALAAADLDLQLETAGGGAGPEADALHRRMDAAGATVRRWGPLAPQALAALMRRSAVLVLPSLYEGVPLVLAEGAACGCRIVATDLPGIRSVLAGPLGRRLELVEPPRMLGPDEPDPADLSAFTARLADALQRALDAEPLPAASPGTLADLTWRAVSKRLEDIWLKAIFT